MGLFVNELTDGAGFGKEVVGLTPADLDDAAITEELRRLWTTDGLVVFRGSVVTEQFQIDLSRIFGDLEHVDIKELQTAGTPELITLVSDQDKESVYEINGSQCVAWIPWHIDLAWKAEINHGGVLRALKLTSVGGKTGFVDRALAYDLLDEEIKAEIANLRVVYRMNADFENVPFGESVKVVKVGAMHASVQARTERDFPPVTHPMVYEEPETGRKVLNVSPLFALFIEGRNDDEGNALLKRVTDHIQNCPAYYHQWKPDELLLWNNWKMLHCVTPAPVDEIRIVQRTSILGDYGKGRMFEVAG